MSKITTAQTIGPFPHEGWRWAFDTSEAGKGRITIEGRVFDGDGNPVTDALVEGWSAHAGPGSVAGVTGLRRAAANDEGWFRFVIPQPAAAARGEPALYIALFARGLLKHQFTAVFVDAADAPLLQQVPDARRATLVATPTGAHSYRWDIHLQGERETVFFDFE
jgi:protocatechuate 3,4-dioxygenase alpha subunit